MLPLLGAVKTCLINQYLGPGCGLVLTGHDDECRTSEHRPLQDLSIPDSSHNDGSLASCVNLAGYQSGVQHHCLLALKHTYVQGWGPLPV